MFPLIDLTELLSRCFHSEFDGGASTVDNNSSTNNIAYVTAQISAKKTGASTFISFLIDRADEEEHYISPNISIISDSPEEYSFTWKYNPVTGGPWTIDSFNSLVAGYRYSAGQGSIQISEFNLIVSGLIGQEERDLSPSSSAIDGESSNAEGEEGRRTMAITIVMRKTILRQRQKNLLR